MGNQRLGDIMGRPYSGQFLVELDRADPERIGVQLARICVRANLPATHVAKAFGVSRMSIHSWFRGKYVREKNYTKIKNFIKTVEDDLKTGHLPAKTSKFAKVYLESL